MSERVTVKYLRRRAREVWHHHERIGMLEDELEWRVADALEAAERERQDMLDTAEAMLRAAGWNGTLEHLNSTGTKPSHFIAARLALADELAEALRYYADRDHWHDEGRRAREALARWSAAAPVVGRGEQDEVCE